MIKFKKQDTKFRQPLCLICDEHVKNGEDIIAIMRKSSSYYAHEGEYPVATMHEECIRNFNNLFPLPSSSVDK